MLDFTRAYDGQTMMDDVRTRLHARVVTSRDTRRSRSVHGESASRDLHSTVFDSKLILRGTVVNTLNGLEPSSSLEDLDYVVLESLYNEQYIGGRQDYQ